HVQHLQVGPREPDAPHDFFTGQLGHLEVGDEQVEVGRPFEQREGIGAAGRLDHPVAGLLEDPPLNLADRRFVVHDHYERVIAVRHRRGISRRTAGGGERSNAAAVARAPSPGGRRPWAPDKWRFGATNLSSAGLVVLVSMWIAALYVRARPTKIGRNRRCLSDRRTAAFDRQPYTSEVLMGARKPAVHSAARRDVLRFQRLVDNDRDLFYRYRINPMRVEYISAAVVAITGREARDFYANPAVSVDAVHPGDRVLIARTLAAADGVARDVTEHILARRRLADTEALLRLLAENARDMIYRFSVVPAQGRPVDESEDKAARETPVDAAHGTLQYVSPAATRLTGRTPDEFLVDPESAWSAVHPDDRALAHAMRTDPEASVDPVVLRWVHPDGTIVPVE